MRDALDVARLRRRRGPGALTLFSAVRSTILPRGVPSRLNRVVTRSVRWLFRLRASHSSSYETRDRIMAMLGPVSLLTLLGAWLTLILAGYTAHVLGRDRPIAGARRSSCPGRRSSPWGPRAIPIVGPLLLTYTEAGARAAVADPAHHLPAQHLRRLRAPGERRSPCYRCGPGTRPGGPTCSSATTASRSPATA